jgi:hypothetical protein
VIPKTRYLISIVLLCMLPVTADEVWVKNGAYLTSTSLPVDFERVRQNMGDRLTGAGKAMVRLQGLLTDSGGTRSVTIAVPAPGSLLLQDDARSMAYDGVLWNVKNGRGGQDDQRVQESLLAHLPGSLLLQLANVPVQLCEPDGDLYAADYVQQYELDRQGACVWRVENENFRFGEWRDLGVAGQ